MKATQKSIALAKDSAGVFPGVPISLDNFAYLNKLEGGLPADFSSIMSLGSRPAFLACLVALTTRIILDLEKILNPGENEMPWEIICGVIANCIAWAKMILVLGKWAPHKGVNCILRWCEQSVADAQLRGDPVHPFTSSLFTLMVRDSPNVANKLSFLASPKGQNSSRRKGGSSGQSTRVDKIRLPKGCCYDLQIKGSCTDPACVYKHYCTRCGADTRDHGWSNCSSKPSAPKSV